MVPLNGVPTVAEQGFPNLMVEDWVGFAVRDGTPNEIVTRLNTALNRTLATPRISKALAKLGAEPAGGTAAEFGDLLKAQIAHWRKVVDAGITIER